MAVEVCRWRQYSSAFAEVSTIPEYFENRPVSKYSPWQGFNTCGKAAGRLRLVPGLDSADWLEEPGGAMGIQPGFGQIVRSAIIPPEYQAKIVDQYGGAPQSR
jgi:hypothetical protein